MSEEKLAEKAMRPNKVEVQVDLYKPFYKFIEEYLAFFGSKYTVEDVCRMMIYESVNHLYRELEKFASQSNSHIEDTAWVNKWPHLSFTALHPEDEEES